MALGVLVYDYFILLFDSRFFCCQMLSRFFPSPIIAAFARGADMQPYANQLEECDDEQECDVATADASTARKRKLQQVSTQQTRVRVTAWMVTDEQINGKLGLFARTARQFPSDFRASQNANSNKAKKLVGSTNATR